MVARHVAPCPRTDLLFGSENSGVRNVGGWRADRMWHCGVEFSRQRCYFFCREMVAVWVRQASDKFECELMESCLPCQRQRPPPSAFFFCLDLQPLYPCLARPRRPCIRCRCSVPVRHLGEWTGPGLAGCGRVRGRTEWPPPSRPAQQAQNGVLDLHDRW